MSTKAGIFFLQIIFDKIFQIVYHGIICNLNQMEFIEQNFIKLQNLCKKVVLDIQINI